LISHINELEGTIKNKENEIVKLSAINKENGLRLDIKSNESSLLVESKESLEK